MRYLAALCLLTCLALPASAQDARMVAAAKATLEKLQSSSFAAKREYCGLLGVMPDGVIASTRPRKGRADSCKPRDFRGDVEPLASFHTHGAFDDGADAEVPSSGDVIADHEEGLNGFISTPGGRLWFIDGERQIARQLCGLGCMSVDPNFQPRVFGPVKRTYTLDELLIREAG